MSQAPEDSAAADPPPSATSNAINLLGYGIGAAAVVALLSQGFHPLWVGILCLLLIGATLGYGELRVRGVAGPLAAARPRAHSPFRVMVKLLALYGVLAFIAIAYAVLLPLAPRFAMFLFLLPVGLAITAILAPAYVIWMDRRMAEPEDGYWHTGMLLLGRVAGRDWAAVRTFALGWIIKGFFLPIMAAAFFGITTGLSATLAGDLGNPVAIFRLSFEIVLFLDLSVAVLGYILTLRLLDTHIRSCNPFWWGWVVTLACYYPFWGLLYPGLLGYEDGKLWSDWLADMPLLLVAWGSLILVVKLGWIWANITFGLRFSNLTHRGILTNGPFRFTKHPSYVFKNAGWWLISLPFLSTQGWADALPNTAALLFISAIYYTRAKAEELHLMADPVYVAYAAWIEQHGAFARLRRTLLPARSTAAGRA